jgi:hypothetical protein
VGIREHNRLCRLAVMQVPDGKRAARAAEKEAAATRAHLLGECCGGAHLPGICPPACACTCPCGQLEKPQGKVSITGELAAFLHERIASGVAPDLRTLAAALEVERPVLVKLLGPVHGMWAEPRTTTEGLAMRLLDLAGVTPVMTVGDRTAIEHVVPIARKPPPPRAAPEENLEATLEKTLEVLGPPKKKK